MNKIEIEEYKGHTIFYDEDSDKFTCDISIEDNVKNSVRKSLKAVRTDINQFIRDNINFKPFKAVEISWNDISVKEVTALRSDSRLVVKGGYIDSYYTAKDAEKLMKYDEELVKKHKQLCDQLENLRKEVETKKKELVKQFVKLDLSHLNLI